MLLRVHCVGEYVPVDKHICDHFLTPKLCACWYRRSAHIYIYIWAT